MWSGANVHIKDGCDPPCYCPTCQFPSAWWRSKEAGVVFPGGAVTGKHIPQRRQHGAASIFSPLTFTDERPWPTPDKTAVLLTLLTTACPLKTDFFKFIYWLISIISVRRALIRAQTLTKHSHLYTDPHHLYHDTKIPVFHCDLCVAFVETGNVKKSFFNIPGFCSGSTFSWHRDPPFQ